MLRTVISVVVLLAALHLPPALALAADGTLWLYVVDEGQNKLPGACFEVYVDDGDGVRGTYSGAVCDDTDRTPDGVVIVNREAGPYVLAQSVPPEGYELAEDKRVTIVAGQLAEDTVVNHPTASPTPTPATAGSTIDGKFDVGGHSLHLNCQGSAPPTVILEAGGPGFSSSMWADVQPRIASVARTCSYDRAFLGESDQAADGPRTIENSVNELRALLTAAGVSCPCVLVGASWGGPIIRLYAGRFPSDVAGLVFVDGVPPGFLDRFLQLVPEGTPERERLLGADNPERVNQLESLRLADAATPPPDVPAAVITHGLGLGFDQSLPVTDLEGAWQDAQSGYADALNAHLFRADQSSSDPVREQPDLVVLAITYVVQVIQVPEDSGGRIRALAITPDGQTLTGACFDVYRDADSDGVVTLDDYVNGACDGDDQVEDGSIVFPVAPGRYLLLNTQPPPGHAFAADTRTRVPPADTVEVRVIFFPESGTPQG